MARIKLITFDLDDTLWPVTEVIIRAEACCQQWLQAHYPDAAQVLAGEQLRQIQQQLLSRQPQYRHNLSALRRDTLAQGFQQASYSPAQSRQLAQQAFRVFHDARNEVCFFPGTLDTLAALAEHYRLGALSNGNADLKKIGVASLFDFHHSAESVGRRKPAADMFYAALRSAGVAAAECVHVGDHPDEDVAAAQNAGFHAVWANPLTRRWPADRDPHPHQINQLAQLAPLLDQFHE